MSNPRILGDGRRRAAKRRNKSATENLCAELRARMVDALLDAARERRLAKKRTLMHGTLPTTENAKHYTLYEAAANHALELADQHLTLTGDER